MSSENGNNENQKNECKDNLEPEAEKNINTQKEEEEEELENETFYGYSDDDSEDENGPYKTHEEKLKRLKELENNIGSRKLEEVYPEVDVKSLEKLKEELENYKKLIK